MVGLCIQTSLLCAQKGSIRLYSELKNVQVYLDEVNMGMDAAKMDSLSPGNHYLKVIKEDVIVYGELVNVRANETTTVLVKETKEISDKLLARKFKEQEIYRSKKLDVLQDTKMVTETTGKTTINEKTKSLSFPGYYSVIGSANTSGTADTQMKTVTKSETSWFITRGNQRIGHEEFAILTNNEDYFNAKRKYEEELAYYNAHKNDKAKWKTDWTTVTIGTVFTAIGVLFYNPEVKLFGPESENTPVGKQMLNVLCASSAGVGSIAFLTGLFNHQKTRLTYPSLISPITLDDAIRDSKEYNRQLKISLGLPETFEIQPNN